MEWRTWVNSGAVVLIAAGLVVWIGLRLASVREQTPTAAAQPVAGARQPAFLLTGTASCSARGCHGSLTPPASVAAEEPIQFDEYTRWNGQDPHTRAYQVLLEDRSIAMVKHLGFKDAHKEPRCLACHVNPLAVGAAAEQFLREAPDSEAAQRLRAERLVGVGCEACHGPAEHWLGPHTTASWPRDPDQKKAQGMWPVEDVTVRGKVCAGCHVGAPPGAEGPLRDANHDLIAAGHPRLQFELGTFLANLPPHWNVRAKKAQDDQTWAFGQVMSAEAALKLLAYRAAAAPENAAPWPEFAEYDCFACHHHLQPDSWRQQAKYLGQRKPGTLPWGSWYFALAGKLGTPAVVEKLGSLAVSMEKPYPPRPTVKLQAEEALTQLAALRTQLTRKPLPREALRKLLAKAVKEGGTPARDELGCCRTARTRSPHALRLPPAGAPVHQLRAFPVYFDSPHGFRPDLFLKALQLD